MRQLDHVSRAARAAGIEVAVCGEMASNPIGAFLILGLDIGSLSVAWPSLPEMRRMIRSVRAVDARAAARNALAASTSRDVTEELVAGIGTRVDLAAFSGRWSLSVR